MMLAWLLAAAALAGPPAGLDLDDPIPWEARARRAVGGPRGACYALSGTVQITIRFYQPATLYSSPSTVTGAYTGPFRGVLDDGTWRSFEVDLTGPDGKPAESTVLIGPILGHVPPGVVRAKVDPPPRPEDTDDPSISVGISSEGIDVQTAGVAARSTLEDVVTGTWSERPSTLYVQWSDARDALELYIVTPLQDVGTDEPSKTVVRFPRGSTVPVAIDIALPDRIDEGTWPARLQLKAGQAHVRGQAVGGQMLPTLSSVSGRIGVVGYTVGYEQRITYSRARACR